MGKELRQHKATRKKPNLTLKERRIKKLAKGHHKLEHRIDTHTYFIE